MPLPTGVFFVSGIFLLNVLLLALPARCQQQGITDISQVVVGSLTKSELDRLVTSVVITELDSIVPKESLLVDIAQKGSRTATRCHTVQGQGAVLQELIVRNGRQEKWRQQVELQIRVIALFKNVVSSKLASEVAKQDSILSALIQERITLTAEGRNYDAVARKIDEARANKTSISTPLLDLVAAGDAVTVDRNRLLDFIANDIAVLNLRRQLQETIVQRSVMNRLCVGSEHACVIMPDSSIRCWGRCTEGQCTPPDVAGILYRQNVEPLMQHHERLTSVQARFMQRLLHLRHRQRRQRPVLGQARTHPNLYNRKPLTL